VTLEEQVRIFHPDCGGIFTGKIQPGAWFTCTECEISMSPMAVFKFAEGIVEPELLAALKRQINTQESEALCELLGGRWAALNRAGVIAISACNPLL
jgi:hypothetical protein